MAEGYPNTNTKLTLIHSNMKLKNAALIVGALALVMSVGTVSAAGGHTGEGRKAGPPQEVKEAVQNNDYDAWYSYVTENEGPFSEHATEEVFEQLFFAAEYRYAGDHDAARETMQNLLADLGIERPEGDRSERERGPSSEVREALQNGDYTAWEVAVTSAEGPFAEHATEDVFNTLVAAHDLREAGDKDGAKELMQALATDLGIELKHRGGTR